jgi:hypothetical protein
MMHTPDGFAPSLVAPGIVPATSLVFAFAGAKLLVGGDERTPRVPLAGELERAGVVGTHHYLGRLQGVDCIAMLLADEAQAPAARSSPPWRRPVRAPTDASACRQAAPCETRPDPCPRPSRARR